MNRAVVASIASAILAGCAHSPSGPDIASGGRIAQINVITAPVGLNVNGIPGADGFSMKVYANDERNPKTVPLDGGAIEILMFNGTFYGLTNVPAPAKIWSFDARALEAHEFKSTIGTGYDFLLLWGTNKPTERLITVVARYHSPEGAVLVSDRSSVTVLDK